MKTTAACGIFFLIGFIFSFSFSLISLSILVLVLFCFISGSVLLLTILVQERRYSTIYFVSFILFFFCFSVTSSCFPLVLSFVLPSNFFNVFITMFSITSSTLSFFRLPIPQKVFLQWRVCMLLRSYFPYLSFPFYYFSSGLFFFYRF